MKCYLRFYELLSDFCVSLLILYFYINLAFQMLKLDIEFSVKWTDFKIMNHYQHNLTNYNENQKTTPRSRLKVDEFSPEEFLAKRKTLNNPNILDRIWKPNLFIGKILFGFEKK